ncbi:MAG: hypothetical protein KUF77_18360 [Candidatus Thiodiazotropha sp. (ex Lucina aurantia)]|uniref:Uncharacterized protein n=1 Tax=Candidatus Thiodiazotropha taylori TaxID=2792791 RepID=A0A9E4NK50_9GAMM|nr:hypothetical protein [Candidatus Thiodiazotropha endolucinida]MBT3013387.1 hypothetical protein [Candidatus Thiodiazotropha sp. (ex Lucina pensylvanica)]MBT3017160.1 hypothetical protein [Candidatus Thiodiazotropha taylori]MBT3040126.1 hypothetical protein [Candidatus Thiodiazotropha sp. (ex Codakia orbicularis)]MBV2104997.1 hypothetical protein [Candidatus Thiodiazotropha sp. (ex Lucina aurantia)]MBT3023610.1 hypothetical protein [Candidatus Thiodiazotropha taylori]
MAEGTGITSATASIAAQLTKMAIIIGHVSDNSFCRVWVVSHSFMRRSVIDCQEWSCHNAPEGNQVQ